MKSKPYIRLGSPGRHQSSEQNLKSFSKPFPEARSTWSPAQLQRKETNSAMAPEKEESKEFLPPGPAVASGVWDQPWFPVTARVTSGRWLALSLPPLQQLENREVRLCPPPKWWAIQWHTMQKSSSRVPGLRGGLGTEGNSGPSPPTHTIGRLSSPRQEVESVSWPLRQTGVGLASAVLPFSLAFL